MMSDPGTPWVSRTCHHGRVKVLLTGGAGNIGSHTLPELVSRGHTVRWFERLTKAKRRTARDLPPGVEVVWGDVTDAAAVRNAAARMDAVVHLAALIPPEADEEPARARAVNSRRSRMATGGRCR